MEFSENCYFGSGKLVRVLVLVLQVNKRENVFKAENDFNIGASFSV